jgi:hypothetical protein
MREVSFKTAELAKAKGFDEPTEGYYYPSAFHINGEPRLLADEAENVNKTYYDVLPIDIPLSKNKFNSTHPDTDLISAPLNYDLQTWLREKYREHVFMTFLPNINKWDFITYNLNVTGQEYVVLATEYRKKHKDRHFDTYEKALDAGLFEILEKLPNV